MTGRANLRLPTVNQVPQTPTSFVNVPRPDYDVANLEDNPIYETESVPTFEDNPIYEAGSVSASLSNQTSITTRDLQQTTSNPAQYQRQFSAPPILNRTPSLPGDRTFVINPLFEESGQPLERSMSVRYARVNRKRDSRAGSSGAGGQSVDQDMSHLYARVNLDSGMIPGVGNHHQYRDMDRLPPSYNDAMVMEKEHLKRMFGNDRYPSYR